MMCMMMHGNHDSHNAPNQTAHAANESLLEILKRRFALGEINEAQFEQMKRVLGLSASAQPDVANAHAGHQQG